MKIVTVLIGLGLGVAVIAWGISSIRRNNIGEQKEAVRAMRGRVELADEHRRHGRFEEAGSLLMQVEMELRTPAIGIISGEIDEDRLQVDLAARAAKSGLTAQKKKLAEDIQGIQSAIKNGQFQTAEGLLAKAEANAPHWPEVWAAVGEYLGLVKAGDFQQACEVAADMSKAARFMEGEFSKLQSEMDACAHLRIVPPGHQLQTALEAGDYEKAEQVVQRWCRSRPALAATVSLTNVFLAKARDGRFEEARIAAAAVPAAAAEEPAAAELGQILLASAFTGLRQSLVQSLTEHIKAGRFDVAAEVVTKAAQGSPEHAPVWEKATEFIKLAKDGNFAGAARVASSIPEWGKGGVSFATFKDAMEDYAFTQRSERMQAVLKNIAVRAAAGQLDGVIWELSAAQRALPHEQATWALMAQYAERVRVQDFKKAEEIMKHASNSLPVSSGDELRRSLASLVEGERKSNVTTQRTLAASVRALIQKSPGAGSAKFQPKLKGRAMVWDFTKDDVDLSYELLPDNLRGSSRDGVLTIFCITKRDKREVGRYSISGQPAYQEVLTVGVVYWPAKMSPGTTTVLGGMPREVREVRYTPEYGAAVAMKEWIAGLPRLPPTTAVNSSPAASNTRFFLTSPVIVRTPFGQMTLPARTEVTPVKTTATVIRMRAGGTEFDVPLSQVAPGAPSTTK